MMQQEDGLLVSYVAGKLVNVIATINQNPNITSHIAEVCFGCDDSSKPLDPVLLILPCLLLSYTSIEVMNTKRRP